MKYVSENRAIQDGLTLAVALVQTDDRWTVVASVSGPADMKPILYSEAKMKAFDQVGKVIPTTQEDQNMKEFWGGGNQTAMTVNGDYLLFFANAEQKLSRVEFTLRDKMYSFPIPH
ncbi:MAG: hypothetical protein H0X40_07250 [Chthoniobacterales bacterium]|nr:hypothetical protein [Chthoniobacterales bacterium]